MAMLRPSLTLVLDLDERVANDETILEIKRNYAYITTPVIRTHAAADDEPVRNTARMMVNMGAYRYLHSSDEGADELWDTVVEPWIGAILHKVGNNMKVFNDRQRKIKLPEIIFDRVELHLQGTDLVVSLHTDPISFIDSKLNAQVGVARALYNGGALEGAVRIDIPADSSYGTQRDAAWDAWIVEHPEALEPAPEPKPEPEPEPEPEKSYEELMAEDIVAKSYENTAVAPTDSDALPPIPHEEEPEEPEKFDFDVDYTLWEAEFADGTKRLFDSAAQQFVG